MRKSALKSAAFGAVLLGLTAVGGAASADSLSFVTDQAALGANDAFSWNSIAAGTAVPNGTALATQNGLGFSVSDPNDDAGVSNAGSFFSSHGGVDNFLQTPIQAAQSFTISLNAGVSAFGAAPEWGGFETATYTLSAYGAGNVLLGMSSVLSGVQGNPAFIGVIDNDGANIMSVRFDLDGPTAPHSAALGDLSLRDSGGVPEPATWAVMLTGLFGAGALLRRSRRVLRLA